MVISSHHVCFPSSRRHPAPGDGVAVGNLPEREERGDEQQAGHRQHGGRLLHAAGGDGPQPAGVRLGTPALLETTTLPPQVVQT